MKDQQSVLNSLMDKDPDAWLEYLRQAKEDPSKTTLSLDVVFHYVAPRAKQQEDLEWAEVAIRAAELEAERCTGPAHQGALLKAMELRSWFIARRGSVDGNVVLDRETIISWVERGLCFPIDVAREKAGSMWANLDEAVKSADLEGRRRVGEDISRLRWIKHRLRVAHALADCGELPADSALLRWLEIREELP